jgi:hypothetical protein
MRRALRNLRKPDRRLALMKANTLFIAMNLFNLGATIVLNAPWLFIFCGLALLFLIADRFHLVEEQC